MSIKSMFQFNEQVHLISNIIINYLNMSLYIKVFSY